MQRYGSLKVQGVLGDFMEMEETNLCQDYGGAGKGCLAWPQQAPFIL